MIISYINDSLVTVVIVVHCVDIEHDICKCSVVFVLYSYILQYKGVLYSMANIHTVMCYAHR